MTSEALTSGKSILGSMIKDGMIARKGREHGGAYAGADGGGGWQMGVASAIC